MVAFSNFQVKISFRSELNIRKDSLFKQKH